MKKGRFIFDDRPSRKEELARLKSLDTIYLPYTKQILSSIKAHKKNINSIIDIGAGTGHTTSLIKEFFPNADVSYFDFSNELNQYAKKLIHDKHQNISCIEGDIGTYSFNQKYDLVFSRFAVKHFHNPVNSIEIMSDILSKNGILCIIDKDVYANIWYPVFPLYKSKYMDALNHYNAINNRGGDATIGRKLKSLFYKNNINVINEKMIQFNLAEDSNTMEKYKQIYLDVYINLIPELVENKLITMEDAQNDISRLKAFIDDKKNTSIILDFVVWGMKNE